MPSPSSARTGCKLRPTSGSFSLAIAVAAFWVSTIIGWRVVQSPATTAALMEGSDAGTMLALATVAAICCAIGAASATTAFVLGPTRVRNWTRLMTALFGVPSGVVATTAITILI